MKKSVLRTLVLSTLMSVSLVSCVFKQSSDKDACLRVNDHEAVDLGLSVKWATCNVGAESPEEYGGYYAWGETEEKSNYSWNTYKYHDNNALSYIDIGEDISGTSYDVARVKWGGNWRMPTLDEIKELYDKCSREWTEVNGVEGQKITGPNGNSIFLPAAGIRNSTELYLDSMEGYYCSATFNTNNPNIIDKDNDGQYVHILQIAHKGYMTYESFHFRHSGYSIRPVIE